MYSRSIATACFLSIILMTAIALLSWYLGDSGTVILAKALFAPFFLLSTKGLRSYFPEPLISESDITTHAKFQFADAALLAALLVVVTARADTVVTRMIIDLLWLTLFIGAANTGIVWFQKRRRKRAG